MGPDLVDCPEVGEEWFKRARLVRPAAVYPSGVLEMMRLLAARISDIVDDPAMPDANKVAVMRDLAAKIKIVGEGE